MLALFAPGNHLDIRSGANARDQPQSTSSRNKAGMLEATPVFLVGRQVGRLARTTAAHSLSTQSGARPEGSTTARRAGEDPWILQLYFGGPSIATTSGTQPE
ncbi:MAG TPA: hypothetical protein VMK12_04080, partial [Anaeromyxobacteraceae bacterium]|nr:hypothetical protein [Anaeromyxobacteraceae bacterium]